MITRVCVCLYDPRWWSGECVCAMWKACMIYVLCFHLPNISFSARVPKLCRKHELWFSYPTLDAVEHPPMHWNIPNTAKSVRFHTSSNVDVCPRLRTYCRNWRPSPLTSTQNSIFSSTSCSAANVLNAPKPNGGPASSSSTSCQNTVSFEIVDMERNEPSSVSIWGNEYINMRSPNRNARSQKTVDARSSTN